MGREGANYNIWFTVLRDECAIGKFDLTFISIGSPVAIYLNKLARNAIAKGSHSPSSTKRVSPEPSGVRNTDMCEAVPEDRNKLCFCNNGVGTGTSGSEKGRHCTGRR